ncbi:MAG: hypothetical protein AAGF12_01005 [Myxococcota bacterium]
MTDGEDMILALKQELDSEGLSELCALSKGFAAGGVHISRRSPTESRYVRLWAIEEPGDWEFFVRGGRYQGTSSARDFDAKQGGSWSHVTLLISMWLLDLQPESEVWSPSAYHQIREATKSYPPDVNGAEGSLNCVGNASERPLG